MKRKLVMALSAYALLALVATLTLDGILRTAMWIFYIGLAAKTIAHARDEQ